MKTCRKLEMIMWLVL